MQIKEIIKAKGYSVTDVADKMGVNRVTLSNMLSGNPTYQTLTKIADAIGCRVGDFFRDEVTAPDNSKKITALVRHMDDYYSADDTKGLREIADTIDEKINSNDKKK